MPTKTKLLAFKKVDGGIGVINPHEVETIYEDVPKSYDFGSIIKTNLVTKRGDMYELHASTSFQNIVADWQIALQGITE